MAQRFRLRARWRDATATPQPRARNATLALGGGGEPRPALMPGVPGGSLQRRSDGDAATNQHESFWLARMYLCIAWLLHQSWTRIQGDLFSFAQSLVPFRVMDTETTRGIRLQLEGFACCAGTCNAFLDWGLLLNSGGSCACLICVYIYIHLPIRLHPSLSESETKEFMRSSLSCSAEY